MGCTVKGSARLKSVLFYLKVTLLTPMKLHLTQSAGNQLITGYDKGWVEVNETRYDHSLIVLPNLLITDWNPVSFEALTVEHFDKLAELKPEVDLLGTGTAHRFAHPRLYDALAKSDIGIECMTTSAACRTYNILMAEGRHVAAALLI